MNKVFGPVGDVVVTQADSATKYAFEVRHATTEKVLNRFEKKHEAVTWAINNSDQSSHGN